MKKSSLDKQKNNKIWGGRFSTSPSELMEEFNSSIQFDQILYIEDIEGSIAHSEMLSKQNIISKKEFLSIKSGLEQIKKEIYNKEFNFSTKLEDIHMNIENRLVEIIGDAGKKLHTARSRNDQVATDIKLWLRKKIDEIEISLKICKVHLLKNPKYIMIFLCLAIRIFKSVNPLHLDIIY